VIFLNSIGYLKEEGGIPEISPAEVLITKITAAVKSFLEGSFS